jgi:hypothetical protein
MPIVAGYVYRQGDFVSLAHAPAWVRALMGLLSDAHALLGSDR